MKPGEERHDISCNFESTEVEGQYELPKYRWIFQYMRNPAVSAKQIQEHQKEMMAEVDDYQSTPVSDIGDQAYWDQFAGVTVLTVYATRGDNTYTLSIQPDFKGEEQMLEQAKALAGLALSRLN